MRKDMIPVWAAVFAQEHAAVRDALVEQGALHVGEYTGDHADSAVMKAMETASVVVDRLDRLADDMIRDCADDPVVRAALVAVVGREPTPSPVYRLQRRTTLDVIARAPGTCVECDDAGLHAALVAMRLPEPEYARAVQALSVGAKVQLLNAGAYGIFAERVQ